MKKRCNFFLMLASIAIVPFTTYAAQSILAPHTESYAFQQYSKRPKSELSKIYYLMDRYTGSPYKVIYDGGEFDSGQALQYAKSYVAKYYKKEKALEWVRVNAYRSQSGQPIYLKSPDGSTVLLRDALVEELELIGS